jgi:TolB protein
MRFILLLLAAFGIAAGAASPAAAQLRVTAIGEEYVPMRIAVTEFQASGAGAAEIAVQVSKVIRDDLASSAVFELVNPAGFIERNLDFDDAPRFPDWQAAGVNAQALIVGKVEVRADNTMMIAFRLYDVFGSVQQFARQYGPVIPVNWRRPAHKIADDVFSQLTGDSGYFDSRVAFVSKSPGDDPLRGRLAIMDQDGANAEFLLAGFTSVINPRFAPTEPVILYGAYVPDPKYAGATLLRTYLYNIETGRQEVLAEGPNSMDYSARFSPDGRAIALSRAVSGNSDIYVIELARRTQRRLTNDAAIDTSPSFSPDGKMIVFVSDRGLGPQLYIMREDGAQMNCPKGGRDTTCRITFDSGRFTDPVWSPRGDWIAFSRQGEGRFSIGVIRPDGTGLRIVTDGYQDESPTWSPNGRVIAFERTASRGAGPKLWSIDLTGRNLRRMPTPRDATNPTWGPLLK